MELRRGKHESGVCAVCGDERVDGCLRCGVALCERHRHGADERCALCEREYESSYSLRDGGLYVFTMLACPSLLCLAVLAALSVPGLGVALAGAVIGITVLAVAKGFPRARAELASSLRGKFLAESSIPTARALTQISRVR